MSGLLDTLAQTMAVSVMPALANAGAVETMSVSRTAKVSDGAGGQTDGTVTTPYTNVPVNIERDRGNRIDAQGKPIAVQTYYLEFPTQTTTGSLISIDLTTDKLVVNARTPYPARTFKIICPANDAEVMNKFICVEEF